ncbi:MAG TPA: hypothetical protein PLB89_05160 [Flavobacteriales bacterium]|nr:hypothetical protein [Flavobacteriales bacterium]
MSKKRYNHPYTDGELVRDLEHNETLVFFDRLSGHRAQTYPEKMRRANAEEVAEFARYTEPHKP